jgi:CubicO group peptidase (beta-lactamase class C family)
MPLHPLDQPPSPPALDDLVRARPAERRVNADALMSFLTDVEAAGLELQALMLWRDGAVVAEGWKWPYAPARPRLTHSVTKSFTACAIGLLIDDGHLSLDDTVASFFPTEAGEARKADPRVMQITVEDLLTMRSGHGKEVSGSIWRGIASSWVSEFFRIPIAHEPGSTYVYSSAASYMLSAIVTRVTGQTLHDYLKPRLFEPLGIRDEHWDIGPDGFNPGGNGISMTLPAMLKLGILHAQNGIWQGQQILPRWWVREATRFHGRQGDGYGYHWVIGEGYYAALGVFVQMILVLPKQNAVLVVNAAMRESAVLLPHIRRHFPDVLGGTPDNGADLRLKARLDRWSNAPAFTSSATPAITVHDTRWAIDANPLGLANIAFHEVPDGLWVTITDADGEHIVIHAFDGWMERRTTLPGADLHHGYAMANAPTAAGARWIAPDRLELVWHFIESAFRDTVTIHFEGDRLTLDRRVNINSSAEAWPTLTATRIT